jgi:hypothetical protein
MLQLKYIFPFIIIFLSNFLFSQKKINDFIYPLEKESEITGNYGEIRPNHFHAGIDFSTDPTLNLPIRSVSDGYVSRIKISSVGYGRVIYITHTNGLVSVYAHQKKYAPKINEFIKQKQIAQHKNEIEVYLNPIEIPVKKGEVIGFTGNSGRSTGPHLHFEIREEKSEIPINPLLIYNVKDETKPILTHIVIYNASDTTSITKIKTIQVKTINNKLSVSSNSIIINENIFAIAYSGYDLNHPNGSKNNIYEAKLLLDNELIYHHQLNYISFDNARYVNFFSEKENGVKFQKCFTPKCYNVPIYKTIKNDGKIKLNDTLFHKLSIEISDEKGNKSLLLLNIKTKQLKGYKTNTTNYTTFCNKDFNFKNENLEVNIKAGSLTRDIALKPYITKQGKATIGNKNEVLLQAFTIRIKITNPIRGKENKMVILNEENCLKSSYDNGWLEADTKSFGSFNYTYDTIAPIITLSNQNKKKELQNFKNSISFKVSDKLSGIKDYNIFINDIWSIAEYDAKTNTVNCYFDEKTPRGKIKIRIEVKDNVDNITTLETQAIR